MQNVKLLEVVAVETTNVKTNTNEVQNLSFNHPTVSRVYAYGVYQKG